MNNNEKRALAQKIRAQYEEKESRELDALRELDARVKRPINAFAYAIGSVGAVVMGAGMSLIMTDIGAFLGIKSAMFFGIAIGLIGMITSILNYPIYKRILSGRKKKYGAEIIELSDKIINE